MKWTIFELFLRFVLFACVAWQASAQEDGETRAAPARGLLKRGLLTKGKQTSTTTTAAPQEEAEYEEEGDYPAEGDAQEPSTETPPSSTEGKKLLAGGVRPFRSNTDLLETLKRRRAQAAEAKLRGPSADTATAQDAPSEAAKSNYSKKRVNNTPVIRETTNEEAPAPAKPSRGRFGRPATRSVQEPETEEPNDAPRARNSRTFRRRGGN